MNCLYCKITGERLIWPCWRGVAFVQPSLCCCKQITMLIHTPSWILWITEFSGVFAYFEFLLHWFKGKHTHKRALMLRLACAVAGDAVPPFLFEGCTSWMWALGLYEANCHPALHDGGVAVPLFSSKPGIQAASRGCESWAMEAKLPHCVSRYVTPCLGSGRGWVRTIWPWGLGFL